MHAAIPATWTVSAQIDAIPEDCKCTALNTKVKELSFLLLDSATPSGAWLVNCGLAFCFWRDALLQQWRRQRLVRSPRGGKQSQHFGLVLGEFIEDSGRWWSGRLQHQVAAVNFEIDAGVASRPQSFGGAHNRPPHPVEPDFSGPD
jgi:hypothetical protein